MEMYISITTYTYTYIYIYIALTHAPRLGAAGR